MGEHLLKVESNEGSHISIDPFVAVSNVSVSEVNFFVSEIVYHNLKISRVESRNNIAYGYLSCNISIVFSKHLMKPLMEGWTEPIHSEIDCVLDGLMPVPLRQRIFIIDNVADWMAVLEASELTFAVAYTQDQVASPLGGLHPMDGLVKSRVPLKHIPQDKREGVTETAFLTESIVRIGDSDFWDS